MTENSSDWQALKEAISREGGGKKSPHKGHIELKNHSTENASLTLSLTAAALLLGLEYCRVVVWWRKRERRLNLHILPHFSPPNKEKE